MCSSDLWRQGLAIAEVPSVYASAPEERAVLDLYGESLDRSSGELEMRARALTCYYQAHHRRPVPEVCMGTGLSTPRESLQKWLMNQASRGAPLSKTLQSVGIGAVVLHLDTLRASDALLLEQSLQTELGPPLRSNDGGERLLLFALPSSDLLRARETFRRLLDG